MNRCLKAIWSASLYVIVLAIVFVSCKLTGREIEIKEICDVIGLASIIIIACVLLAYITVHMFEKIDGNL